MTQNATTLPTMSIEQMAALPRDPEGRLKAGDLETVSLHCRCGNSIVIAPAFWDGEVWICPVCGVSNDVNKCLPAAVEPLKSTDRDALVEQYLASKKKLTPPTYAATRGETKHENRPDALPYKPLQGVTSHAVTIAKEFIAQVVTGGANPADMFFQTRVDCALFIINNPEKW